MHVAKNYVSLVHFTEENEKVQFKICFENGTISFSVCNRLSLSLSLSRTHAHTHTHTSTRIYTHTQAHAYTPRLSFLLCYVTHINTTFTSPISFTVQFVIFVLGLRQNIPLMMRIIVLLLKIAFCVHIELPHPHPTPPPTPARLLLNSFRIFTSTNAELLLLLARRK